MPASRSRSRGTDAPVRAPPRSRKLWLLIPIGVLVLGGAVLAALPASLLKRFLPPQIQADEFTGSIWHGSAARVAVMGRDVGAVEWRLHPWSLLQLTLQLDIHWVKLGFVIDGGATATRAGITLNDLHGGGPLQDLRDFAGLAGWTGTARIDMSQLAADYDRLLSAVGNVDVLELSSSQVAAGADLGNYQLQLTAQSVRPDGAIDATVHDLGGPLQAQAQVHFAPQDHTGTLTGTVLETAETAPALREQLANLTQLRARDAQGRIAVDVEVSL
jgi:hypothetical protein